MPCSIETVKQMALSFPEAQAAPHFTRTSFRTKRKIFATLDESENLLCLMLSPEEQDVFCLHDPQAVFPVPNQWGVKGATYFRLELTRKSVIQQAMKLAYDHAKGKTNKA